MPDSAGDSSPGLDPYKLMQFPNLTPAQNLSPGLDPGFSGDPKQGLTGDSSPGLDPGFS